MRNLDLEDELVRVIPLRRSVRSYELREVPDELIVSLMEAAVHAPSPHNTQPWSYVLLSDLNQKERVARAMGNKMAADLRREGTPPKEIERRRLESYRRITRAPRVMIACVDTARIRSFKSRKRTWGETVMAMQSLAASIQNLLLAAGSKGLAASWMAAPLYCPGAVRKALGLPESLAPQALITLGYGQKLPPKRPKLGLDQILLKI